jgi:hypothetical protein
MRQRDCTGASVPPTIDKAIATSGMVLKPAARRSPPLYHLSDGYHAGQRSLADELCYRRFCASAAQDEKPIGP